MKLPGRPPEHHCCHRVFPAMSHSGVHDVAQGAIVNAAFKFVINQKDKQP